MMQLDKKGFVNLPYRLAELLYPNVSSTILLKLHTFTPSEQELLYENRMHLPDAIMFNELPKEEIISLMFYKPNMIQ